MTEEIWKPLKITGGDYQVSNFGRVKSMGRTVTRKDGILRETKDRILKNNLGPGGYMRVGLGRKIGLKLVHHLVALEFIGPRPKGMLVLHWDDDKNNNCLSNLRYGTMKKNGADGVRNDRYSRSELHHAAKFSNEIIAEIRTLKGIKRPCEVYKAYGMSKRYLFHIWSGKCRTRA